MDTVIDIKKPELKVIKENEIHHLLEPGEFGAVLELIVSDPKTGKITEHRVMKSKSFVQQLLQLLYAKMALSPVSAPVANVRDTTNNLRSVVNAYQSAAGLTFDVNAAITVITYGIVIGTGALAPTISDFQLGTPIAHATMNHSAMTFGTPAADATTSQVTLTRNFTNVSGAPVTVNEIALYCRATDSGGAIRYFMVIRDVIAGGMAVPNGQTLTANYRPQVVI